MTTTKLKGTQNQIAYATDLQEKVVPWIEIAKQYVSQDQHEDFLATLAPVLECEDCDRLIPVLERMPTVCDGGTHFSDGRAAHEIKPDTWQRVLQDAVLALR